MKKFSLVLVALSVLFVVLLFANNILYVKKVPQTDIAKSSEVFVKKAKSKLKPVNQVSLDNTFSIEKITASNVSRLAKTGPDAISGIGDWHLTNGTLCVIVSGVDHENELSSRGGVLTDLGFCNRPDDQFTTTQDLLDADQKRSVDIERIETEIEATQASIITYGQRDGVDLETRYSLNLERPTELSIKKIISLNNQTAPSFNLYTSFWFNYHSMQPFVFSSDPEQTRGFNLIDFISRGSSAIPENFYLGSGKNIGLLQLPQIPLLNLEAGERLMTDEVIYVGERADVASITNQIYAQQTLVQGQLADSQTALHVDREDGSPFTFIRPEPDGSFSFRAPIGKYRLRHRGSAKRNVIHTLTVADETVNLGKLSLAPASRLKLPRGNAMRLVFVGVDGTEDPHFTDQLTDFNVFDGEEIKPERAVAQIFLAGIESDLQAVDIPHGTYKVYATGGPEYSLSQTMITINESEHELVIDVPQHVVKTPGFIAADLHVHSGGGFDNTFSTQERVRTFVAEHGEVMVSSEHDVPLDFSPHIVAMGVTEKITSINAVEMTSTLPSKLNPHTGGHVNFFPVNPKPNEYRDGMIAHESKRLREILHAFREEHPDVIAQLNHARQHLELSGELPEDFEDYIDKGGYLNHMGVAGYPYNPEIPLHTHPNNSLIETDPVTGVHDLDIDAMEIVNPSVNHPKDRVTAMRKDWLSFIKQGHKIVGTANSDSHHANEQVAVPRNMVAVENDSVTTFQQVEFLQALKNGNVYGTTGPMLEVFLADKTMGQTFTGSSATLQLKIQGAHWIPIDEIKIQINGEDVQVITPEPRLLKVDRSATTRTLTYELELKFEQDAFLTIEVMGNATPDYTALYPMLHPYAFSNPIYIDADNDGQWQPPGL